jgi:hypothetical protein
VKKPSSWRNQRQILFGCGGGAAELSQMIPIGTVYDNGIPDQNPDNPATILSWFTV